MAYSYGASAFTGQNVGTVGSSGIGDTLDLGSMLDQIRRGRITPQAIVNAITLMPGAPSKPAQAKMKDQPHPGECCTSFRVILQINWEGSPPKGLSYSTTFYGGPQGAVETPPASKTNVPSGVGGRGTILYEFRSPCLDKRGGTYPVEISTFDDQTGQPQNFWAPGFGARADSWPFQTSANGKLIFEVTVGPCERDKRVFINIDYKAPKPGEDGGGGAPPERPKEAPEGAPPGGPEPPPFGPEPQVGASPYEGVETSPPVTEGEGGYEMAAPEAAAEPYGPEPTLSASVLAALDAQGMASLDPIGAVISGSGLGLVGGRDRFDLGPPWTQLDLLVDPDGSMDAAHGIRTQRIHGQNSVRGLGSSA
jgi:hypothetical protein